MHSIDTADLGRRYGIHYMLRDGDAVREASRLLVWDRSMAFDAQPQLVTAANSSVPSLFTTIVDPKVIEVQIRPTKAAELYGEEKRGTWVSDTAMFLVAERTGEVESYGDFGQGGMSDANFNFPQRQSYHYQTNIRVGDREQDRVAEAKLALASQKQYAAATVLSKYQNFTYLYGVAGLQNYGGTNDPDLPPAIAPTESWYGADPAVIFGDILRLVQQAIAQGNGLIDAETRFKLGISPDNAANLNSTNEYNYNVLDQVKKNFPNMSIVTVPEFAINGGGNAGGEELVQLIAVEVAGQRACSTAFTEKMRAHAMVRKTSSWEQKRSQGTWGTIFYYPAWVAQMIG